MMEIVNKAYRSCREYLGGTIERKGASERACNSTLTLKFWAIIITFVFALSFLVGLIQPSSFESNRLRGPSTQGLINADKGKTLRHILSRNFYVLTLVLTGIGTGGFMGLLQVAWNAFELGLMTRQYQREVILILVLPHAVIEFPSLILATSGVLWAVSETIIGVSIGRRPRIFKKLIMIMFVSIFLMLLAGLVETYVTPVIGKRIYN
jgi:uncharacterized membrane protein SpoIIM required for sporulation